MSDPAVVSFVPPILVLLKLFVMNQLIMPWNIVLGLVEPSLGAEVGGTDRHSRFSESTGTLGTLPQNSDFGNGIRNKLNSQKQYALMGCLYN